MPSSTTFFPSCSTAEEARLALEIPDPIIRIENLSKSFGDLVVFKNVTMDIARGKSTTVLGPSGTGKSVLIKHIVGLLAPDEGNVWVEDVNMATAPERVKLEVRGKFGMLFQHGALFDSLTAGENVEFPMKYHRRAWNAAKRREVAMEKLRLVELERFYDTPTASLSGGQRKRVGLARAIALEPEVVLFDEPNSGLDPLTSATIDHLIRRMQRQLGITFITISHDIVQAMDISDYIAMLYGGALLEYASRDDFLNTRHRKVREFLHRNVPLPEIDESELIDP